MITIGYLEKVAGTPMFNWALGKLIIDVYVQADFDTDDITDIQGWAVLAENLGMFETADLLYAAAGLEEWNDDRA